MAIRGLTASLHPEAQAVMQESSFNAAKELATSRQALTGISYQSYPSTCESC